MEINASILVLLIAWYNMRWEISFLYYKKAIQPEIVMASKEKKDVILR